MTDRHRLKIITTYIRVMMMMMIMTMEKVNVEVALNGALDNFNIIPSYSSREICIQLETYAIVMTTCLILLITSTHLQSNVDITFISFLLKLIL